MLPCGYVHRVLRIVIDHKKRPGLVAISSIAANRPRHLAAPARILQCSCGELDVHMSSACLQQERKISCRRPNLPCFP